MSKISDELRNWFSIDHCGSGLLVSNSECDRLLALADRIDKELMELPRDRDGSPIHVGDTVYLDDGRKAKVTRIGIGMDEDSIYTIVYGDDFSLTPGYVSHTRPDSWKRIADELEEWSEDNRVNGDGEVFERARQFSDRIRKLAEREDE
jgi:hypothetical protein